MICLKNKQKTIFACFLCGYRGPRVREVLKHADVVIAGGGLVGLPLALALAQGGLRTVIVDAAPVSRVLDPAFDGRVSALAYASVRMLTALGVWGDRAPPAQPIREILVSDGKIGQAASPFSLHFDAQEVGHEA